LPRCSCSLACGFRNALRAIYKAGDDAGLNPEGTERVGARLLLWSGRVKISGSTLTEKL